MSRRIIAYGDVERLMGHGDFSDETYYEYQTVMDNIPSLTTEVLSEMQKLQKLQKLIMKTGHEVAKRKHGEPLRRCCDSFVAAATLAILTGCGGGSPGAGTAQAPSSASVPAGPGQQAAQTPSAPALYDHLRRHLSHLSFTTMDGSRIEPHGKGTVTYPDGTRYEGGFCEGKLRGHGVFTFPDGRRSEVGVRENEGFNFPKGTRFILPDGTDFIFQGGADYFPPHWTKIIFPDSTRFNFPDEACPSAVRGRMRYLFPDGTIFTFPIGTRIDNEGFIIPDGAGFRSFVSQGKTRGITADEPTPRRRSSCDVDNSIYQGGVWRYQGQCRQR